MVLVEFQEPQSLLLKATTERQMSEVQRNVSVSARCKQDQAKRQTKEQTAHKNSKFLRNRTLPRNGRKLHFHDDVIVHFEMSKPKRSRSPKGHCARVMCTARCVLRPWVELPLSFTFASTSSWCTGLVSPHCIMMCRNRISVQSLFRMFHLSCQLKNWNALQSTWTSN